MKVRLGLLILLLIFVCARAALPWYAKNQINAALEHKLGAWRGHIEDVDLSLLAGTYTLKGLHLSNSLSQPAHDLLTVRTLQIGLSWSALLYRRLMLEVNILDPVVNAIESDLKVPPTAKKTDWQALLHRLMPFDIQDFTIENGALQFDKTDSSPHVSLSVDQFNGSVHDIGNLLVIDSETHVLPTSFEFSTRLQHQARLAWVGRGQFLREPRILSSHLELDSFDLTALNDFMRAYGYFDLTKGTISVQGSLDATWPTVRMEYQVKMRGLDVVAPRQKFKGARGLLTELGLALVNLVVRDPKKVVTTELLIQGNYPHLKLDKWEMVKTLIQ